MGKGQSLCYNDFLAQIIDRPLTHVAYPSEASVGKSPSRADSAAVEPRDSAEGPSPAKPPVDQQPPVGVSLGLPSNVSFFEEPQVARWDDAGMMS